MGGMASFELRSRGSFDALVCEQDPRYTVRNWRAPFLIARSPKMGFEAVGAWPGKSRAAAMAGIVKQTIYTRQWREDAEFQKALGLAKEMACVVLEDEATRRAVEGVERPVGWYKGKPGGVVREYSDTLLMFLLKVLLPDKYRERVDARGSIATIDLNKLPDELIARIAAGEHPLSVLATVEPIAIDSQSR